MVPRLHHAVHGRVWTALGWGTREGHTTSSGALLLPPATHPLHVNHSRAQNPLVSWLGPRRAENTPLVLKRASPRPPKGSLPPPLRPPPLARARPALGRDGPREALPRLSTTKSPGQNSLLSRWWTGKRSLERMLHSTEPSCHITSAEVIVVTTSTATLQGRTSEPGHTTGKGRYSFYPSPLGSVT